MPSSFQLIALLLTAKVSLHGAVFASKSKTSQGTKEDVDKPEECSVYLAESSIPNAGLGVFAGKDFAIGDRVGMPGLGIQVTDPDRIYEGEEIIEDYGWNPVAVGGITEADTLFTLLPGVGMLANYHPTLDNVVLGSLKDEPLLQRSKDPAAGASTSYHDFSFIAGDVISAGQEIFVPPGDGWLSFYDSEKDQRVSVPLKHDYESADAIVAKLAEFRKNYTNISEAQFLDILYRMKNEVIQKRNNLQHLIPDSIEGLHDAASKGTARTMLNERKLDWLKSNGKCLDNIRPGPSTIPGAGRGAFATRFIPEGSVIAPAPLVQVMDREAFNLESNYRDNSTKQLLLNYCFGHRKSSLLLCPTTSVTLINHSRDRLNAVYNWSTSPMRNRVDQEKNYLTGSLDEIRPDPNDRSSFSTKLMLDFVATRDIQPGEEIFIDYGEEWETAWEEHIQQWEKPDNADTYVPASVLNSNESPILLSDDPSQVNHWYLCRIELFAREDIIGENVPEEDFKANPSMDVQFWEERVRLLYGNNNHITWRPCDVTAVDPKNNLFHTIVYTKSPYENQEFGIIRRFKNVPRSAIRFADLPYHSDQHLATAFRHYISVPDGLFPLKWRDDYVSADSVRLGATNEGTNLYSEENREALREYEKGLQEAKCGVYVAPSNIPNAGMGTYVGYTSPGKGVPLESRVPVLPVVDLAPYPWDANDYVWSASAFNAEFEITTEGSISILAVNEGSMANFHPGLVNHENGPSKFEPMLDRCKDPGSGAFSDYVEFSFESLQKVEAGEEVFISYGEHWFRSRKHLGSVPLSANYLEANRIVASLMSLTFTEGSSLSGEELTALLDLVKTSVVEQEKTSVVLASIKTPEDLRQIMSKNGTAEATVEKKSLEWLEENGYCTDHIYSKDSTIKQAGKGAFARRFIKEGNVIIQSPLLLTWGRHMFEMNATHLPRDILRKQLIYNYQFAHPESSVLFFPANTAFMINHQSERTPGGISPNAEIRWSVSDKRSMYYLQRHLDDLKEQHYATMIFDIIATRDIHPDEEVFIDYGEEWENAWNQHVKNFVSPCHVNDVDSRRFKSSKMVKSMNNDKFNATYHTWGEDHFTVCVREYFPTNDESAIRLMPEDYETDTDFDDVETHVGSFREVTYNDEGFNLTPFSGRRIPCKILRADPEDGMFDVVYFTKDESTDRALLDARYLRRMRTLPAESIEFINKPYKSDMFWSGAFRHEIKIPDEIFPPLWKDLKREETDSASRGEE